MIFRAPLAATVLFSLAFVCAASAAPAKPSEVLRVRALGEPQTLDWNKASTWIEGFIIRNTMEGLLEIDSDLKPAPSLAQSWTIANDFRTYTFKLRKGVKWADGIGLKAQDFLTSWRTLLAPETAAKYAFLLFDIEGAEEFHRGKLKDFGKVGIKALDDSTLQVSLNESAPHWIWVPTFYATFPKRVDAPELTLGPYRVAAQEPGRRILLKKNTQYSRSCGNLNEIDLALVPDDSTALNLYESGQIDFLAKLPSLERKRFAKRKDFHTWPDLRTVHLRLNTKQGPTAQAALRRAISYAINRPKLSAIFEGGYKPASSFVPPSILGFDPKGGLEFDPEKAKRELKASGFDVASMPPLHLLTVAFDDQIILAQFIQQELKTNLGLNVRIHILEPKRYYAPSLVHTDFAMQINFWGADFPDPDNFFSIFLSNSGLNRYGWSSSKYDELVTQARRQSDSKARERTYRQAQKILLEDDVVTVPLYYGSIHGLVRPNIYRGAAQNAGFSPGAMNWWLFKELSRK